MHRTRPVWSYLSLSLLLVATLTGCEAPLWVDEKAAFPTVPPDFALVLTVRPGETLITDLPEPLTRPAQHIVTPDRTLRVAFGSGVTHDLYPPATATLSPQEIERLWRIIVVNDLLRGPEGTAQEPGAARYDVAITADGDRHAYATTPGQSPGVLDLLRALARLRGDAPD